MMFKDWLWSNLERWRGQSALDVRAGACMRVQASLATSHTVAAPYR
jgi:hypothetical protein